MSNEEKVEKALDEEEELITEVEEIVKRVSLNALSLKDKQQQEKVEKLKEEMKNITSTDLGFREILFKKIDKIFSSEFGFEDEGGKK